MTKIEPLGAVRERVLETLREEIIAGRLGPGDRLVEREPAEPFGISQVPVREAARTLVAEGFALAASRATPADLADLAELLKPAELLDRATAATAADDAEAITDVNTRFHDRILATADYSPPISAMEPGDPARARSHALTHLQANHRSTVRHLFGTEGDL
ncbi:GntR family transcriptional regulator [Streptomyces turgidiscabies]|uniref:DNA-binding GntR family transcriptional regulator n=1 Tax=Streptomyces turgidiscabies TaxID=85558 RepID=A0ABU0RJ43_9ACTN|nr:GntR family transcriptional regulator [Streptomyces turgidiscabies]MDQ0931743.1 DNA-binding GntR family transcriptional regulator [Streptomyces turgidiscabies]